MYLNNINTLAQMIEVAQNSSRRTYNKVNGFSQKPSGLQILGLLLVAIVVTLHAYIIPSITAIHHTVLNILLAFYFALLLIISVYYFQLMLSDPVDPRLLQEKFAQKEKDKDLLKWCKRCKVNVHACSYHCKRCDRCVEEFDHHCKYVNNCIGKQNYALFYRFLLSLIMFLISAFGQGLWVFLKEENHRKWVALALLIVAVLLMLPLAYLALFHCYITFWGWGTTLKWIQESHRMGYRSQQSERRQRTQPGSAEEIQISPEVQAGGIALQQGMPGTESHLKRVYMY